MYRLKQSLTVFKKVAPFYPFGFDDSKGNFYEKQYSAIEPDNEIKEVIGKKSLAVICGKFKTKP
ncbi:hypothetical protein [Evansella halocellulosilytica]|uniref:hypothetical protein n=1 Tax=Evansella halocellulosilytica TaxID=2011013 RepID=UPI000BB70ACD|nr:hypothetical protein [Evansella halocellulosilytica]